MEEFEPRSYGGDYYVLAGIRYYAKGETAQNLFGGGTFGTGFNPLTGPTQIQVSKVDLEEALELIEALLE